MKTYQTAKTRGLPNRLWSFLVPCTVPSGRISRLNPVLQYNCRLRWIPFKCVKSAEVLRESLSAGMEWPVKGPMLSPIDVTWKCDPTWPKASIVCKSAPTSPIVAITNSLGSNIRWSLAQNNRECLVQVYCMISAMSSFWHWMFAPRAQYNWHSQLICRKEVRWKAVYFALLQNVILFGECMLEVGLCTLLILSALLLLEIIPNT